MKRRTRQILTVAGLTAIVGTAVPVGVVVGLQQNQAAAPRSATAPPPASNQVPATDKTPVAPAAGTGTGPNGSTEQQPEVAPVRPADQFSAVATAVDNTDPAFVADGSLPTFLIQPPTAEPGYVLAGPYAWRDASGAALDASAFLALANGTSFSAVWTFEPLAGSGLPYTYTQRFVVAQAELNAPADQVSALATQVDNAARTGLPADLLAPPSPEDGYAVSGAVAWTAADGTTLTAAAFARLTEGQTFTAVWTLARTDGRSGTYTYAQRFVVALPRVTNPGDGQSAAVTAVDNLDRDRLPTDLLVAPSPADGYTTVGTVQWQRADGTALRDADFADLADGTAFSAVWTFARADGAQGAGYSYVQRFVIAQPPLIPVQDQVAEQVTEVDNTLLTTLPSSLLAPPTPSADYRLSGTVKWTDATGQPLSPAGYAALRDGASFRAVWNHVRIDGRTGAYSYAQRFAVRLTTYANERSAEVIAVDNYTTTALPNDQRAAPVPKPGYEIWGSAVWQLVGGATLSSRSYPQLLTGTDFGAVWSLRRIDGQAGSYTYTQRFVTRNAGPATTVYPTSFPVLTDTRTIVFGESNSLPFVMAPHRLAGYKEWSDPVFTREADGTPVTDADVATLPAGTSVMATLTAEADQGYRGQAAAYRLRFVVQKAAAAIDSASLSSYGYGLFSPGAVAKVLTGATNPFKPARVAGYADWAPTPVMQVKINQSVWAVTSNVWLTVGDGTNGTVRISELAGSIAAQLSSPGYITYADTSTGSLTYGYEYRYVWQAALDQNHTGVPTINYVQNYYLTNHAELRVLLTTPVYDVANTGYAADANFRLSYNGKPLQVSFANLAEAINYRYPPEVRSTTAASPIDLGLALPAAKRAVNGETVPVVSGDFYTSKKTNNVSNDHYFYKWLGGKLLLSDVDYAPGLSDEHDLTNIVGRHVAFGSRPLVSLAYESDDSADLVALANNARLTDTWYYAGVYYIPQDYAKEQLNIDEIQKLIWNWKASDNDTTGQKATDYQMLVRVGSLKNPTLTGYDSNGNAIYNRSGYSDTAPFTARPLLGNDAGKVSLEQLQAGYFKKLHSSAKLYTNNWDKIDTSFNIGSFTYIKDNVLRSFVFAYFDNLPLSNVKPDLGFTYLINGMTLSFNA